jgi:uncharacterized protein YjiS (DUF1127 family)
MRVLTLSLPHMRPLNVINGLANALALRRQRQHLAMLDAAQLHDIGLTADQAIAESKRPIWDAPPHWRL